MNKLRHKTYAADVPTAIEQFCKIAAQAKVEIVGGIRYDVETTEQKGGGVAIFEVDMEADVKCCNG